MANTTHNTNLTTTGSGWVTFAGILMVVAGFLQAIAGLVALFKPALYVTTENHLLVLDFNQWGWVHLIYGIILIVGSASLYAGRLWARVLAITLAAISALLNFAFIWAYPLWSIMIIIMDILVIYGVAMYGGRQEE